MVSWQPGIAVLLERLGLLGTGIEIPFHEANIFNLNYAHTDCLLSISLPAYFSLESRLSIDSRSFGIADRKENSLLLSSNSNFLQAVTDKMPFNIQRTTLTSSGFPVSSPLGLTSYGQD